jgi:hypothetical protein
VHAHCMVQDMVFVCVLATGGINVSKVSFHRQGHVYRTSFTPHSAADTSSCGSRCAVTTTAVVVSATAHAKVTLLTDIMQQNKGFFSLSEIN